MEQDEISGIRITLQTPDRLSEAVRDSEHVLYDPALSRIMVTFENVSDAPISLPLPEIKRSLVRSYTNVSRDEMVVDNKMPPPRDDGEVTVLAPGETDTARLALKAPDAILIPDEGELSKDIVVRVCIDWKKDWLRAQHYEENAFAWNADFTLCNEVIFSEHAL